MSLIHPMHVNGVNEAFGASNEAVSAAERLVEVFLASQKQGRASLELDGRMVDVPVFKAAVRTLENAQSGQGDSDLLKRAQIIARKFDD